MSDKILLPVDGSETSDRTIRKIIEHKGRFTATPTLLHVVNVEKLAYRMIPEFQVEMIREHALKSGQSLLEGRKAIFDSAGFATETRIEMGSPREIICRIAEEEHFDLVILGRRGMGEIRDVLFGSVSNYVLHHVRCPVLLF